MADAVAFWFFTVQLHCVLVPGSAMKPWTNCAVDVWFAHVPPTIT